MNLVAKAIPALSTIISQLTPPGVDVDTAALRPGSHAGATLGRSDHQTVLFSFTTTGLSIIVIRVYCDHDLSSTPKLPTDKFQRCTPCRDFGK